MMMSMMSMIPATDPALHQADTSPGALLPLDDVAARWRGVLDGWLAGLSPKTVKAYRSDLNHLARWAVTQGAPIPVTEGGEPDRLAGLVWLLGRGQGPAHTDARRWLATMTAASTRARRRSCLRSFADLAVEAGALTWPLRLSTRASVDRVAADPDARPATSPDLVAALWECTAGNDPSRRRERAILALLLFAGLRRFEICALDIENLDLTGGRLRVKRKHSGEALAQVELARPVVQALHAHLRTHARTGPVFTSRAGPRAGERLAPDAIGEILARLCERCGAPTITPHATRHHGATLLAAAGADAGEIQEWLGHSSGDAARSYIRTAGRTARRRAAADRIEALIDVAPA